MSGFIRFDLFDKEYAFYIDFYKNFSTLYVREEVNYFTIANKIPCRLKEIIYFGQILPITCSNVFEKTKLYLIMS